MKKRILTNNSTYVFIPTEGITGTLTGGRIKEAEGTKGRFITEVLEGSRPVFVNDEPVTLVYAEFSTEGREEVEVPAGSGIRLSTVVQIEDVIDAESVDMQETGHKEVKKGGKKTKRVEESTKNEVE